MLTNDSEWAAAITDPASHLDKVYHVQINRRATADLTEQLERGCVVDGERLRAKAASVLRVGGKNSWLAVTLDEGRNRQIRRLLEALGIQVLRLVRVAIGPLPLGELPKSAVRQLTPAEKTALDRALRQKDRAKNNGRVPKDVG